MNEQPAPAGDTAHPDDDPAAERLELLRAATALSALLAAGQCVGLPSLADFLE